MASVYLNELQYIGSISANYSTPYVDMTGFSHVYFMAFSNASYQFRVEWSMNLGVDTDYLDVTTTINTHTTSLPVRARYMRVVIIVSAPPQTLRLSTAANSTTPSLSILTNTGAGAELYKTADHQIRSVTSTDGSVVISELTDTVDLAVSGLVTPVTLASAGGTSLVNDGTGPALATKGLTAGTGVGVTDNTTDLILSSELTPVNDDVQATAVAGGYEFSVGKSADVAADTILIGNRTTYSGLTNTSTTRSVIIGGDLGNPYDLLGKQNVTVVGYHAGRPLAPLTIGNGATLIGYFAGYEGSGTDCVAVGTNAGQDNIGNNSIAIGSNARAIGADNISIGNGAGSLGVNPQYGIGIGFAAFGPTDGIGIGRNANVGARVPDLPHAIGIGYRTNYTTPSNKPIAVGYEAGNTNNNNSVLIGHQTGKLGATDCVIVGNSSMTASTATGVTAIGNACAASAANYSICIGQGATTTTAGRLAFSVTNLEAPTTIAATSVEAPTGLLNLEWNGTHYRIPLLSSTATDLLVGGGGGGNSVRYGAVQFPLTSALGSSIYFNGLNFGTSGVNVVYFMPRVNSTFSRFNLYPSSNGYTNQPGDLTGGSLDIIIYSFPNSTAPTSVGSRTNLAGSPHFSFPYTDFTGFESVSRTASVALTGGNLYGVEIVNNITDTASRFTWYNIYLEFYIDE